MRIDDVIVMNAGTQADSSHWPRLLSTQLRCHVCSHLNSNWQDGPGGRFPEMHSIPGLVRAIRNCAEHRHEHELLKREIPDNGGQWTHSEAVFHFFVTNRFPGLFEQVWRYFADNETARQDENLREFYGWL